MLDHAMAYSSPTITVPVILTPEMIEAGRAELGASFEDDSTAAIVLRVVVATLGAVVPPKTIAQGRETE